MLEYQICRIWYQLEYKDLKLQNRRNSAFVIYKHKCYSQITTVGEFMIQDMIISTKTYVILLELSDNVREV